MDCYGFDEKAAEDAIIKYREYFSETGIFENEVYEGMQEFLKKLKATGKTLIVATSKPEVFAKRILVYFELDTYFDDVCGATMDNKRSTKEEVIRYALERNDVRDYSKAVMVGDRMHDVEGAKAVGIDSIGVLYGFGSREELEMAGAGHIAETLEELYKIIIG
jgi:phosphoglycolate phosphatase